MHENIELKAAKIAVRDRAGMMRILIKSKLRMGILCLSSLTGLFEPMYIQRGQ